MESASAKRLQRSVLERSDQYSVLGTKLGNDLGQC